jgi:hypothetical protein
MINGKIRRKLLQVAATLAVLIFLSWALFSPLMTKLVAPLVARFAGIDLQASGGRWDFFSGGILENAKFATSRWSGEISKLQMTWHWAGFSPQILKLHISGLQMIERPISEMAPSAHTASSADKKSSEIFRGLPFLTEETQISLRDATVDFGEIFPRENTRASLSISEADLLGKNFTKSAKINFSLNNHENAVLNIRLNNGLLDTVDSSWTADIEGEISFTAAALSRLSGTSLHGKSRGLGLDLLEFAGSLQKDDIKLAEVEMATTFEAASHTGAFDLQLHANINNALKILLKDISGFALRDQIKRAELSAKISWSPDGWEALARGESGEVFTAGLNVARRPGKEWEWRDAYAKVNMPQIGNLEIRWLNEPPHDETTEQTSGIFNIEFKFIQLPEEVLRRLVPAMTRLQLDSGFEGTAKIRPIENFWCWEINATGQRMSLQQSALLWSVSGWKLSANGNSAQKSHFLQNFTFTTDDDFRLQLTKGKKSETVVVFNNLTLLFVRKRPHADGGINLRQGTVTFDENDNITYEILGRDIPSVTGWIAPGTDRNTQDWLLKGRISRQPDSANILDNHLFSPADCEDCKLTIRGTFKAPNLFSIQLIGSGVDFTNLAHPSELALGVLQKFALQESITSSAGNAADSTEEDKSSLLVGVTDCVVPRLGPGDIKGQISCDNKYLIIEDADINLEVGGATFAAVLARRKDNVRLEKISGALKTIRLSNFKKMLPKNFAPYLSGYLTLSGELLEDLQGNLAGQGIAEWNSADISTVPAMKKLLEDAGKKISPEFSKLRLESGRAQFRLENGNLYSDELMIYGDEGILEISGNYNIRNDDLNTGVVFHLKTEHLRKTRIRIGGITVSGQTLVTFGRQQDDITTLPGVLPVSGKLNGQIYADWNAWLDGLGIPAKFLKK